MAINTSGRLFCTTAKHSVFIVQSVHLSSHVHVPPGKITCNVMSRRMGALCLMMTISILGITSQNKTNNQWIITFTDNRNGQRGKSHPTAMNLSFMTAFQAWNYHRNIRNTGVMMLRTATFSQPHSVWTKPISTQLQPLLKPKHKVLTLRRYTSL